ncbi:uncharacterized protein [Solanum lycopersicum]|uniref:uncharacterized protein n=1 Tax=Solanum lycopersicum TaxID=4081 RepID=UPI00374A1D77
MRNHSDRISDQQVVEKILISVKEKYEYIVAITEETKDLSKLSIKELVGSFRAHEKRRFFREDQPKETAFHNEWYVDSGCSNHMTGDEKVFLSINNSITTTLVDAKGKGTISINMKGCGKQIHDVLYVPDLEENLLSVSQVMKNGYSLVFRDNYCKIYD